MTVKDDIKNKLSNESCRHQANKAIERRDYDEAIAWLNTAYARTIGHKKSERYDNWACKIAREQGIQRHSRFAKDEDAVDLSK